MPHKLTKEQLSQIGAISDNYAIVIFDTKGYIVDANEKFLNIFDYSIEEVKGKHHSDFWYEELVKSGECQEFLNEVLKGKIQSLEIKRARKDGHFVLLQAIYTPIKDENGKVTQVLVSAEDKTDRKKNELDLRGKIESLSRSQAIIEFDTKGNILDANENFLKTLNYTLDEIKGRKHKIFCDEIYANSIDYKLFWNRLKNGEFQAGEFQRLTKYGRTIWIQATYNPIYDIDGKVVKIVKYATDITKQKELSLYYEGQIKAISKSQAIIEFNPNGIVLNANENFLETLGYSLDEIQGQPHSIFCEDELVKSNEYKKIWASLRDGYYHAGAFKRIRKDGLPVWIQATYNPIYGVDGKIAKIVKFAHNITKEKELSLYHQGQIEAISKAQAVIEFDKNGVVLNANENFLKTLDYTIDEIQGKHHSIFCEEDYVNSRAYKEFWATLKKGEYHSGQYKRIDRTGQIVWIQASYNPIYGIDGEVIKIIKFAHDITEDKKISLYYEGQIDAISKSQAVIEFDINGVIIKANNNFLTTTGYTLEDVQGKHHSMFCDRVYANSKEYKKFWDDLKKGIYHSGKYRRIKKDGETIWIRATYNPIIGVDGKIVRIVKFAHDITKDTRKSLFNEGKLDAISKSQAIIEFDTNGFILDANENFLKATHYTLEEIVGKHHKIFCEEELANSDYYKRKWRELQNGKFHAGQFKRIDKHGKILWIQATYNPIYGINGKIVKIVKFAHNITEDKELSLYYQGQIEAISKAQAVIEFTPDGIVLNANENFLKTVNYEKEEILGKHHSIFCDEKYAKSKEYKKFWKELKEGIYHTGKFKRYTKDGEVLWLRANYNPIYGNDGKVIKIIKFAHNITDSEETSLYYQGQIDAISKSQAVIEFDANGNILDANDHFLDAMHYHLDEIQGKHHSIFCDDELVKSERYEKVWKDLKNGHYQAGQFKRLDKYGQTVWIRATYNPIYGLDGKVSKVIKFAHNITKDQELSLYYKGQIEAISRSQAVIEFDINGVILNANDNFLKTFSYTLDEVQDKHHSMFCEESYTTSSEYKEFWDELKAGIYHKGQFKRLDKEGKTIWIRATYNPIYGINGEVIKIVKFAHDITQDQEASLYYKGQIEAIDRSQAVVEFDMNGTVLSANDNFLKAMDYSLEEIKGKHHSMFCQEEYAVSPKYYEFWEKLQKGIFDSGKYLRIGKNGKKVWIRATYTPILNIEGKTIRVLKYAQDITELETIKIDKLTGLYNQGKLISDIKPHEINNLAIIDSKEYANINDFYGSIAGDTLIIQFADILKNTMPKDFVLYRLHNDNFAILNNTLTREDFMKEIDIIRIKVNTISIDAKVNQLNLTLSCGLSYGDSDEIINYAKTALNYAKNTDQVVVTYSKELHIEEQFQEKIFWSKKINNAIKEDRIIVHFQAVFNNATQKIEKHEVLVRALEQDQSLIYPNKFLDIAKTSRQYLDITKIVIEKSFREFKDSPFEFSINLTLEDMLDTSLQEFLFKKIKEYKVGKRLTIEIVESEQIREYKPVIEFIKKIKEFGSKIAIDDFGSGYSNFEYLLELDADYVKIDGTIVSKLLENDYSSEIVKSIVSFCQKMGIKTIAEFVSSEELLDKVTTLGVDYSQGFYTGRPEKRVIY
ncbi:MAG: PAS domain S-box protein [Arcobacter sp.]|nr:PAS domain S-box protein [Arcobacter sp.]